MIVYCIFNTLHPCIYQNLLQSIRRPSSEDVATKVDIIRKFWESTLQNDSWQRMMHAARSTNYSLLKKRITEHYFGHSCDSGSVNQAFSGYAVNQQVSVFSLESGDWCTATVTNYEGSGKYKIRYKDNDREVVVPVHRIVPASPNPATTHS